MINSTLNIHAIPSRRINKTNHMNFHYKQTFDNDHTDSDL